VTRWVGLVLPPLEEPAGHETLEPAREQARRDPEVLLELIEARVPVEGAGLRLDDGPQHHSEEPAFGPRLSLANDVLDGTEPQQTDTRATGVERRSTG
jgi:hypothetical protein